MKTPKEAYDFVAATIQTAVAQLEKTLTNSLADITKIMSEQREQINQLIAEIMQRSVESNPATSGQTNQPREANNYSNQDLQATIDELRAQIARFRTELKVYRNTKS